MTSRRPLGGHYRTDGAEKRGMTREEAQAEAKRLSSRGRRWPVLAYPCRECGEWHVGRVRRAAMQNPRRVES